MAGIRSSFRLLEDKPCSSEIKQMKWSPTMDLLAVITKEGEIWLQRLSWQRVWSISVNELNTANTCNCLAWRGDGKVLAAGFTDGTLKLFDVEDTECIHSCNLGSSIQCMEWTKQHGAQTSKQPQFYQDKSETFLPHLKESVSKATSTTFPKENSTGKKEDPKRLKQMSQDLSILVVGDAVGKVHLLIHGIFLCGSLSTHDSLGGGDSGKVLSVVISADFKLLSVVVEKNRDEEGSENYAYLAYNTMLLSSRCEEIGVVSWKYGQIITLMEQFEETLQSMTEAWEEILLEIDSKLTQFSEKTSDPDKTIGDEFLALFTCGIASPEMQHFLVHQLTEKGLKKLGSSIDHSYTNVQNLTMKQLHSLEDALMFHMTDFLGMSRWYDKFGILGLTEVTVQKSVNDLGAFILKTHEMLQVINSSTKSFKAFFKWIYIILLRFLDEPVPNCIRNSSDLEVDLVLQFLEDHLMKKGKDTKFCVEKVGQYLFDDNLKIVQDESKSVLSELLNFSPMLKSSPLVFPHHSQTSLKSSFKILSESVAEVFRKPLAVIGASISNIGCINLVHSSDNALAPRVSQCTLSPPLQHTIVFTDTLEFSEDLYMLSVPTPQTHPNHAMKVRTAKCHFQLPESEKNMKISDVVFYTDETVTILLQDDRPGNNVESILVQFPTSSFKDLDYSEVLSTNPKLLSTCLVETDLIPHSVNVWDCVTHSRSLAGMQSGSVSVSGTRKVSAVLSNTGTRVRLLDMEAQDEEDDNGGDSTIDDCSMTPANGRDEDEGDKENKCVAEQEESDGSL